jgi:hypothetical protein
MSDPNNRHRPLYVGDHFSIMLENGSPGSRKKARPGDDEWGMSK